MAPTEVRRRGTMRSRHSWKTSPALERGAELGKMNRGKLCIAAHAGTDTSVNPTRWQVLDVATSAAGASWRVCFASMSAPLQQTYSGRSPPAEPDAPKRGVLSELLCGAFGGLCAALATHPLDTIKTRMQSGPSTTVAAVVRSTLRVDGVRGLYRGISVPVVSQPLYVGSSFAGLQAGYYLWDRYRPMGITTDSPEVHSPSESWARLTLSGGLGGAACALAVTPGERLKVLLQVQGGTGVAAQQSPLQTMRAVVATGGWQSMFVGLQATMVREIPGTVLWFGAFEVATGYAEREWGLTRPLAVLCGAVAAGSAFWLPVIPIDTVKTRQQTAPSGAKNGLIDISMQIVRTRGFRGFWAGMTPILTRGILLDIFQFSGADWLRNVQTRPQRNKLALAI